MSGYADDDDNNDDDADKDLEQDIIKSITKLRPNNKTYIRRSATGWTGNVNNPKDVVIAIFLCLLLF